MKNKLDSLQLFAEGISGEGNAAAAGQQTAGESPARAKEAQAAAAKPPRLSWAQILADPEYNREMQKTISARLKAAQLSWEKKNGKTPSVQTPAQAKPQPTGATPEKTAPAPMAPGKNLTGENAPAPNLHPDRRPIPESAGGLDSRIRRHYDSLVAQERRLQREFPDFSLQQALKNPAFVHLTAPHVGVSVENAFYLCNRQKHQARAMQLAAQKTAEKLSNAIRSGTYRPVENGTAAQAPTVTAFDYTHATAQQRLALKEAIRRSASRGEKLYPTDIPDSVR